MLSGRCAQCLKVESGTADSRLSGMKNDSVGLTGSREAVIGVNTLCYIPTLVKPLSKEV